jgi:hypothetical protein
MRDNRAPLIRMNLKSWSCPRLYRYRKRRMVSFKEYRYVRHKRLSPFAATMSRAVGSDLQFGHQEQIENTKGVVIPVNNDRSAGWRPRNEVRMLDEEGAAVAHVNRERAERLSVMHVAKLLDCHGLIVRLFSSVAKLQ